MAAASYVNLYLSNGQVLNVLIGASAAIATNPYVNLEGVATSANVQDFQVRTDCCIRDIINTGGAATAGQMEVYNVSKSLRTGRFISQITADYAVTVATRNVPKICFKAGQTYRFIQSIAQVS